MPGKKGGGGGGGRGGGGGGGHNIIHVKHLSRACICNARGGLWSPLRLSCVLSFFILFHPSSSLLMTVMV